MAQIRLDDAGTIRSQHGEPTWEMADLFPRQGEWTIDEYLSIEFDRGVEYDSGRLEFLPVPTEFHQDVLEYLFVTIREFVLARQLGKVHVAGLRVRTHERKFREPDVVFLGRGKSPQRKDLYWEGADLAVEVVSKSEPKRDWVKKRAEYARAGIAEYWIADPRDKTLTVFTLDDGATEYREAGRYGVGETACSLLLDGLTIDVTAAFTHE